MTTTKRNKKEEQKKLFVRIVCIALVVVMAVTSLLAMLPSLFQTTDPELQAMIDAGYLYVGEDGTIYATEEYIELLTQSTEDHEGHDHE